MPSNCLLAMFFVSYTCRILVDAGDIVILVYISIKLVFEISKYLVFNIVLIVHKY